MTVVTIPEWQAPIPTASTLNDVRPRDQAIIPENYVIPICYGPFQRKPDPIAVAYDSGTWTVGYLVCLGEIEAIDSIWINGAAPVSGVSTATYTGSTSQTADSLLSAAISGYSDTLVFTDEHGSQGLSYIVLEWSEDDHYSSWPEVVVEGRGRKVFDVNASTTQYSTTPGLYVRDFVSDTRIVNWDDSGRVHDSGSFATVQTDNEATVTTEARRADVGLVIDRPRPLAQWLDVLALYAGAYWYLHNGQQFALTSDRPRSAVRTLTRADIIGSVKSAIADPSKTPTVVRLQYTDTAPDIWRTREVVKELSGVDTGDVQRRETSVAMVGVTRRSQAGREASEYLNRLQHIEQIEAVLTDDHIDLVRGEVITLPSLPEVGIASAADYVIQTISESPQGRVQVRLFPYDATDYVDTEESETFNETDGSLGSYSAALALLPEGVPPPEVQLGVGATTITFTKNSDDGAEGSNDGEIRSSGGWLLNPSEGISRELSAETVLTPWEGAAIPEDGVFYLLWMEDLVAFHTATFNRTTEQWTWYDNTTSGTDFTFDPDNHFVIGVGTKTLASGGIAELVIVTPPAAEIGTNLFSSDGTLLQGVDVENDYLVSNRLGGSLNENPGFDVAHSPNGNLRPANWYYRGDDESEISYVSDTSHDQVSVEPTTAVGGNLLSAAIPVNGGQRVFITIRARSSNANTIDFRVVRRNTSIGQLPNGKYAIVDAGATNFTDAEIETDGTNHSSTSLANIALTATYALYQYEYEVPDGVGWISFRGTVGQNEVVDFDYVLISPWKFNVAVGTDLYDSQGNLLEDVDVANDYLVGARLGGALNGNPGFNEAWSPNGNLRPLHWYLRTSAENNVFYEDEAVRDNIEVNGETALVGNAIPINDVQKLYLTIRMRSDNSDTIDVRMDSRTQDLPNGQVAILDQTAAAFTDSELNTSTANNTTTLIQSQALTTGYSLYQYEYTPPTGAILVSPRLMVGSGEHCQVDYFIVSPYKFNVAVGTDLYDSNGNLLEDVDVANDFVVGDRLGGALNNNASFNQARSPNGNLRPSDWYLRADVETRVSYTSEADHDIVDLTSTATEVSLIGGAIPIDDSQKLYVTIRARSSDSDVIAFRMDSRTADLSDGQVAILDQTSAGFTDSEVNTNTVDNTTTLLASPTLTTSFALYQYEYTPPAGAILVSPRITLNANETCELDYFIVSPFKFTVGSGDIDDDAVTQGAITDYAVVRQSFDNTPGPVNISGSGFLEIATIDITIPATVTNATVLLEVSFRVSLSGGSSTTATSGVGRQMRFLDDDDVVIDTRSSQGFGGPIDVTTSSARNAHWEGSWVQRVTSSNLNANQTNTFKFEMDRTTLYSSANVYEIDLRATLLNGSEN